MSRTRWIQLGSLAAIVGGVTVALVQLPTITVAVAGPWARATLERSVHDAYFQREAWAAMPAIWLLFALALVGLRMRQEGRIGPLGRSGARLASAGAVLLAVGDATLALVSGMDWTCVPPTCTVFDSHNYATIGRITVYAGTLLFSCGIGIYGVMAVRRLGGGRGWDNVLPPVAGVLALVGPALWSPALLSSRGDPPLLSLRYVGSQPWRDQALQALGILWVRASPSTPPGTVVGRFNVMPVRDLVSLSVISLVFALSWVLLGATMWPGKGSGPAAQAARAGQAEPTAG